MDSIPVISLNVIRQCIAWHFGPLDYDLTTVSTFRFPSGKLQTTVLVNFDRSELVLFYGFTKRYQYDLAHFTLDLQDCFCKDIIVVTTEELLTNDSTHALLSCIVEPHDNV